MNDFSAVVAETAGRARMEARTFDHPMETNRTIDRLLVELRDNTHTFSIETHPEETTKNKAGQFARRLALNPSEQRRLNKSLLELVTALDERAHRQDAEITRLRTQVDRLLAAYRTSVAP